MSSKAVTKGRGRGGGKPGSGAILRKMYALLRKLSPAEARGAIHVFDGYARAGGEPPAFIDPGPPPDRDDGTGEVTHPLLSIDDVAEAFKLVADLMAGSVGTSGDTCDATDVACFIHNEGEVRDSVEAILALTPIARRLHDRLKHAERSAELQETLGRALQGKHSAVKRKKQ